MLLNLAKFLLACLILSFCVPANVMAIDKRALKGHYAFIIGNDKYQDIGFRRFSLERAVNDANRYANFFKNLGWEVYQVDSDDYNEFGVLVDQTGQSIGNNFRNFLDAIDSSSHVAIIYSGHGISIKGKDYFVPVDANMSDIKNDNKKLISIADEIFKPLLDKKPLTVFTIFDACRNDPNNPNSLIGQFGGGASTVFMDYNRSEKDLRKKIKYFNVYSSAPGQVSYEKLLDNDGDEQNSAFTRIFAKHLETALVDNSTRLLDVYFETFKELTQLTYERNGGYLQQPFLVSNVLPEFNIRNLNTIGQNALGPDWKNRPGICRRNVAALDEAIKLRNEFSLAKHELRRAYECISQAFFERIGISNIAKADRPTRDYQLKINVDAGTKGDFIDGDGVYIIRAKLSDNASSTQQKKIFEKGIDDRNRLIEVIGKNAFITDLSWTIWVSRKDEGNFPIKVNALQ